MRRALGFALSLVLVPVTAALPACSPRPLTETIVVVDADAQMRSLGGSMRFEIHGGPGRDPSAWPTPMMQTMALTLPLEIGIIPQDGDTSRSYEVRATALDYGGHAVGEARVVSGFVAGEVNVLRLRVDHGCMGVTCPPGMACGAGGTCRNEYIDAISLPSNDPVPLAGTYMLTSTLSQNDCMLGGDMLGGTTMGIVVDTTETSPGHYDVVIGGVWSSVFDLYVGSHTAQGVVVDNHLTAVMVGTRDQSSGTCSSYKVNGLIDLDLSTSNTVTGTVSAYAVTNGAPSCAALTGCTTVYSITGMRM